MIINRLELSKTCDLVSTEYCDNFKDTSLNYIERSNYCMYSADETSIDIDKEMAIKIIDFLQCSFDLKGDE
jgi:hypothetical protein